GTRFGIGRDCKATSAYIVNLRNIAVGDEIVLNMMQQKPEFFANDIADNPLNAPATPKNQNIAPKSTELPF
ncbi:MAG TPA: hypothetical protein PLP27_12515, partial [Crocinitomicaceae bacterium]|nr:hypothetical protein [Crocinitomicaceae bacterium]